MMLYRSLRECLSLDPVERRYFTHYVDIRNGQSSCTEQGLSNIAVAFVNAGGGVVGANDYLVQQQASPNNTVLVAVGKAYVPTADGTMVYATRMDATQNVTIAANSSGNPRIDAVVLYIDLSVSPDAAADNVAKFFDVQGTPSGSPVAPTNAQILAAIGSGNPYLTLATVAAANGFTSINSSNLTDQRAIAKISGGDSVFQSDFANYVHSGLTIPTSASLTTTAAAGVLYFNGNKVAVASDNGHTYTASNDTYVDVSNTGTFTYSGVANGAGAPALTASSLRIAKVVTSGTAVTGVVQGGFDSNNVAISPATPLTKSWGGLANIPTFANAGDSGKKIEMGSASLSLTGAIQEYSVNVTFPTAFAAAPKVTGNLVSTALTPASQFGGVCCGAITATTMTMYIRPLVTPGNPETIVLDWIAIG